MKVIGARKLRDLSAADVRQALADTPKGQQGRPSRSLTLDQALAVMTAAAILPVTELRPGLKKTSAASRS